MQMPEVVTVDVAAAAAKPSAEAIAAWAGDQRVFVSSVMVGLAHLREAAVRGVEDVGAEPVWFEGFGGRDDDAQAAYLSEVASSTIYLGVLDRIYGRLLPSHLSATHEEYREAERRGLRVSVWVRADGDLQGDQITFLDEVRQFHVTGSYATAENLRAGVVTALGRIAAEELSPWCMVGDAVFRARSIEDDGTTITIRASVHDPSVLAELEGLRSHGWGGAQDTTVTWAGRCLVVRPRSVTTTTTISRASDVVLQLERTGDGRRPGLGAFFAVTNINGRTYGAGDLTAIGLRQALFAESQPADLMGMVPDLGDIPSRLPTGLNNSTHQAVLRLLITRALVGAGNALRVTRVQVSPLGPGGRHVVVEWIDAATTTPRGTPSVVDGYVRT